MFVLYTAKSFTALTLTGSSTNATVGVQFSIICETNITVFYIKSSFGPVCLIQGGYSNNTCMFSGTYNLTYDYECNLSSNTYKVIIPSSVVTESLHNSYWSCEGFGGGSVPANYTLHVNVPVSNVTIASQPNNGTPVNVIQGKGHTFSCTTNAGRPSARIQWYLSTSNFTTSATTQPDVCNTDCRDDKFKSYSSFTYIGNLNDNGKTLFCTAVNTEAVGVRSNNVTINIVYGPNQTNIYPPKTSYIVTETESIGPITCTADCKPDCTMTWSGPNLPTRSTSILNLTSIDRNQSGNYQCTAKNDFGNMTSTFVNIVVEYGPRLVNIYPSNTSYTVVEKGSIGPILCTADCNPNCTMTWSGQYISGGTTSTLNLQNIDRNQAGNYQCTAQNINGVKSVNLDIIVNYGPTHAYIDPQNTSYTLTETGSTGPITCTAECKPDCTMTWSGPNLHTSTTSILNLTSIDRNQSGIYQCTAKNNVGNVTSTFVNIVVEYGPRLVNITPSTRSYTVVENGNINSINCAADCKPVCTITWSGPNFQTYTSSILSLQNIDRNQSGNYQCMARNDINIVKSGFVVIIVRYGPRLVTIEPSTSHYTKNESLDSLGPIKCNADCNPACRITWYGPGISSGIEDVLNYSSINRNHSGNYSCVATNNVSYMSTMVLSLVVNYVPTITTIDENITINENASVVITCKIDSIPLSNVKWMFENRILETDGMFNLSNKVEGTYTLTIEQIRCLAMGTYRCVANNMLGETNRSMYVTVKCSPRLSTNGFLSPSIIPIKEDAILNITVPIIAFPAPTIFFRCDENGTYVNAHGETLIFKNINKHSTTFIKRNLTEKDFGFYRLYAYNGVGNTTYFLYSFEVISERKPNTPENITCEGSINSVALTWQSQFNGGPDQFFTVYFKIKSLGWENENWISFKNYTDPGQQKYITDEIKPLQSGASYIFKVHAVNVYNFSSSTHALCNTSTEDSNSQNQNSTLTGGIAGLGAALFILVIVGAVAYLVKSRRFHKKGKDTEPINSSNTDADSFSDELKDNPMYVSYGPKGDENQTDNTDYIAKNQQDTNNGRDIYAVSQKGTKEKSNERTSKNAKQETKNKHIVMGNVYENSDDIVAARFNDIQKNTDANRQKTDSYRPKRNKDGLVYVDLDLRTVADGKRFVIRGLETRTNYAEIDLSKKADPLPDTDSDEEKNSEVKHSNVED